VARRETVMVVRVVYASKYGSTREVAEAIAEEVGREHDVVAQDAGGAGGFEGVDAIVLGSAIYGGRWLDPARDLAGKRAYELTGRPIWLFSVGPIGDPLKPEDAGPDGISETIERLGARGHEIFAGKLDYSKLGRLERLMVRALHAPAGDFRDWDAIRAWARSICEVLSRP
jgi:menaquinone-dependent protoporphyrinogen oxidase